MMLLKNITNFLKKVFLNKYLVTLIVFGVILIFVGENNLINRYKISKNVKSLQKEINFYKNEIDVNTQKKNDIESSDENLERYAREKYYLRKDKEDIFIIKERD